jgi:hypothetical protein
MKTIAQIILVSVVGVLFTDCNPKKNEEKADRSESSSQVSVDPTYRLEEVWASEASLKTPESVIFDETREVIYVSNVNENPWEKDGNGFISKMSATGEILDLEWVSGFNGPKGMAIVRGILFVADLDELVLVDIEKGEIQEKVIVDGAEGMNDITPDGNGGIYMSDSPAGKIFHYANGTASEFNADAPGRPNGLFVDQGKLFAAFSEKAKFVHYNPATLEETIIAEGIGHGDGITPTNEPDTYLVSDWSGEIFIVNTSGTKQSLLNTKDQEKNTADIWFIQEKDLLLVPTFFDNRVVAYKLVKE